MQPVTVYQVEVEEVSVTQWQMWMLMLIQQIDRDVMSLDNKIMGMDKDHCICDRYISQILIFHLFIS
jgi:hypothetical protein